MRFFLSFYGRSGDFIHTCTAHLFWHQQNISTMLLRNNLYKWPHKCCHHSWNVHERPGITGLGLSVLAHYPTREHAERRPLRPEQLQLGMASGFDATSRYSSTRVRLLGHPLGFKSLTRNRPFLLISRTSGMVICCFAEHGSNHANTGPNRAYEVKNILPV